MEKLLSKVIDFSDREKLIQQNDHILCAVSGGADSIFLVEILNKLKKKYNLKISVAHFNHSLRKNSDLDEKFVKNYCEEKGLEFYSQKANVKEFAVNEKLSIEEAGRILRYDFLEKVAEEIEANKIATAHHSDDNLETVIHNLIRGTGIKGLTGIPPKRGKIIRPLLVLTKEEIEKFLEANKIKYRLDESNLSLIYRRNLIRHKIVPLFKRLNPNIVDSIERLSIIARKVEQYIRKSFPKYEKIIKEYEESIVIEIADNIDYFEIVFLELLRDRISEKFGFYPVYADIDKILSLISKEKGKHLELTEDIFAIREENKIVLCKSKIDFEFCSELPIESKISADFFNFSSKLVDRKQIKFTKDKFEEYIDADKINGKLTLRLWRNNDKIKPLGLMSLKNVSEILTNAKVSSLNRRNILVLKDEQGIIWICGITISDDYKITDKSKRILQLKIGYKFDLR